MKLLLLYCRRLVCLADLNKREVTMFKDKELTDIEKNAYQAYISDGLAEIAIGLFLLGAAFNQYYKGVDFSIYFLIKPFLLFVPTFLVYRLGKNFITSNRLGVVKFGVQRMINVDRFKKTSFVFVPILLIDVLSSLGVLPEGAMPQIIKSFFSVLYIIGAAYLLELPQALFFAIFAAARRIGKFSFAEYFDVPFNDMSFTSVFASLFIIAGLIRLFNFLKKYPKDDDSMPEFLTNE